METTNEMVEQLLKTHYKSARISKCNVNGDGTVVLVMMLKPKNLYARAAQRILNTCPDVKMVLFTGGFIETVYTRSSLKFAGFKIEEKPKPQPKHAEPDYEKTKKRIKIGTVIEWYDKETEETKRMTVFDIRGDGDILCCADEWSEAELPIEEVKVV